MVERLEYKDFRALVDRVQTDDPSDDDIALLRKQLPLFKKYTKNNGNLATQAALRLLNSVQATPADKELIRAGWEDFARQLGIDESPPLEEALVHHAALCWLRHYIVEQEYTNIIYQPSLSFENAKYWEGRLNAAQRRFLRAMETLARVRKMKLPPIQVNIAQQGSQQANVMGDVKVGKK